MIPLSHNIPIPHGAGRVGRPRLYPFDEMQVGDSFLADVTGEKFHGTVNRAAKRTGFKFTTRKVDGGIRVWRVKK